MAQWRKVFPRKIHKIYGTQLFSSTHTDLTKSHAISYSYLSFQCAWLLTHYEEEWLAAYLDKESEKDDSKVAAIKPDQRIWI
jgi:hypothetical protein